MSDAQKEFHILLALCITEWAAIENELFSLFSLSLHTTPEQEAIIFFRTPTLDSRLTLTDEMLRTLLPRKKAGEHDHAYVKEWSKLLTRIRERLNFRNCLAHWPRNQLIMMRNKSGRRIYEVRYISSINSNELPRKTKAPKPIIASDMEAHFKEAQIITSDLHNFYLSLFEKQP